MPYEALTQCWYTREHRPTALRYHEDDGSTFSICRYCGRRIVTWGKHRWSIADGLDVSRLAETVVGRFLTVLDKAGARVLPAYHEDNYVSLMPGERRTLTVRVPCVTVCVVLPSVPVVVA